MRSNIVGNATALKDAPLPTTSSQPGKILIYYADDTWKYRQMNRIIGTEWNTTSTSPTLTRVNERGEPITLQTQDIDAYPIYSDIEIVNLTDSGVVNAVHGDSGFTLDGSNGQVMTRFPKFYYKREWADDAHNFERFDFSNTKDWIAR